MNKNSSIACSILKRTNKYCREHARPKIDILVKVYENRIFIAISDTAQFGTFISIKPQLSPENTNLNLYDLKLLFGEEEHLALARYIAEQIKIDRPLLLSIAAAYLGAPERADIVAAIDKLKTW